MTSASAHERGAGAASAAGAVAPGEAIRLEFTADLATSVADAFAALTEAARLERWFCDEAGSEPRAGGVLRFAWKRPGSSPQPYVGRWIEWDPPRLASYAGGHSGYPGGDAGHIRLELEPAGDGARLHVTHALPNRPEYAPIAERYRDAWPRAIARLARHVEPQGRPA